MTVKPSDGISWRSCGKCKLRYGFEGGGMSHPHKDDGTFLWYIGWGDDLGYWPALPLPTGVHVQGEPQGGWGEVQLPGGVTVSIPDADGLEGQPRHYTVKRGQALFHLRLSGEKHWCIWKNKGRLEVAATRYCATPRVAIDALVASLNLSYNNGELEDFTSHASDVPPIAIEGLTDRVADAILLYRQHGLQRTKAALDGGGALVELRETLRHGDFGPHCLRLGLGDRTAQRWMQLAQSGLSAEEIQARGGIKKTLKSLSVSETWEEGQLTSPECPIDIKDAPPDGPELTSGGHVGSFDGLEEVSGIEVDDSLEDASLDNSTARDSATKSDTVSVLRRCSHCRNTARRGADLCRPCEYQVEGDRSTRLGLLIRENRWLRKANAGLKWQLYGNKRPYAVNPNGS